MKQVDNIADSMPKGGAYNEYGSDELTSLSREQLNILQQINNKTGTSGGGSRNPYSINRGIIGEASNDFNNISEMMKSAAQDIKSRISSGGEADRFGSGKATQSRGLEKASAIGNTAAQFAIGQGAQILGSSLLGPIGGIIAGGTIGYYVQESAEQARIKSDYDKYFLNNSSSFINMANSTSRQSLTGFGYQDAMKLGKGVYDSAPGLRVSQEELQTLTMQYTNSGLLYGQIDTDSTINKIKELTQAAKKIAILANTTLEQGTEFMEQMRKLGVTDTSKYSTVIASAELSSGFLGTNARSLASATISNTASMISGTGISAGNVLSTNSTNNFVGGLMYSSLFNNQNRSYDQNLAYNYINNIGVDNVGSEITQITSAALNNDFTKTFLASLYKYNPTTGQMEYDSSAVSSLKGLSTTEIGRKASANLQEAGGQNASSVLGFLDNAGDRSFNDMTMLDQVSFLKSIVTSLSASSGNKLDNVQILKSYFGLSEAQASMYGQYLNIDSNSLLSAQVVTGLEDLYATRRANKYGGLGQGWESFWGGVGQGLAAPFVAVSDAFSYIGAGVEEGFHEFYYGRQLAGSDLITQTDFWNRDVKGKKAYGNQWNEQAKNIQSRYDALDGDSKKILSSAGLDMSSFNSFYNVEGTSESASGKTSSETFDYSVFDSADELQDFKKFNKYWTGISSDEENAIEGYLKTFSTTKDKIVLSTDADKSSKPMKAVNREMVSYIEGVAKKNGEAPIDTYNRLKGQIDNGVISDAQLALDDATNVVSDNIKGLYVSATNSGNDGSARYAKDAEKWLTVAKDDSAITNALVKKDADGNVIGLKSVDPFGDKTVHIGAGGENLWDSAMSWFGGGGYSQFTEADRGGAMKFLNENMTEERDKVSLDAAQKLIENDNYRKYLEGNSEFANDANMKQMDILVKNNATTQITDENGEIQDVNVADLAFGRGTFSEQQRAQGIASAQQKANGTALDISNTISSSIYDEALKDPVQGQILENITGIRNQVTKIAEKVVNNKTGTASTTIETETQNYWKTVGASVQ